LNASFSNAGRPVVPGAASVEDSSAKAIADNPDTQAANAAHFKTREKRIPILPQKIRKVPATAQVDNLRHSRGVFVFFSIL
jgi:hypothetical protein